MKEKLMLLKASILDIYGLRIYHSKIAYDMGGEKDKKVRDQLKFVYNFKKFNRGKTIIFRELKSVAKHFGCEVIVVIPASSTEKNNLQKLFGDQYIKRTKEVKERKYQRNNNITDVNKGSLEFNLKGLKNKKVLLVDDISTTGKTLLYFSERLKKNGIKDVVMFAIGLNKKLKPSHNVEIELTKERIRGDTRKGRPSIIDDINFDLGIIELLVERGFTDREVAFILGVSEQTFNSWKQKHPDFLESVKNGKGIADEKVKVALYKRACGYEHPEDKIFLHDGEPVVIPTIKHYPPDTAAAFIWLKNRNSLEWRDKQEVQVSGIDGLIEILQKDPYEDLENEETDK